jgi:phospholipase/carboxylesterase
VVPLVPEPLPELRGTPVFMGNGRTDPLIPAAEAQRLARLLEAAGASVTTAWQPGGHELSREDISAATGWLSPLLDPGGRN